ncbi:hypothetical protein LOTGIDRAFT_121441 [Lottia gigantea]|uniref:Tyrosine-protein kinase ephrin type A/B receptor-like domain-containing protein n=1 Tax=Lottia gigantea TaxID=225164 RepID=V3ZKW1_LOTGI|nr:hypothetical protein LOTGIDRAFT_121441 [Lottia gigantea]ESO91998.1 hypothetical protein LOTGIDRAFT_121441 [Lottia gigantea]
MINESQDANLFQEPCPEGTYTDILGTPDLASCKSCPPTKYCPQATDIPIDCPLGYYCPPGTAALNQYPCPAGTYSNQTTRTNINDCLSCPGGYCPEGSSVPLLCQAGYYLNSTGNSDVSHCITCTSGMYCAGSGNTIPDGPYTPQPVEYNCTLGHYCPSGSTSPIRCNSGSYQDEIGQWTCKACPAGYYCDNTMSPVVLYNDSSCPTGFYCPENTTRNGVTGNICPPGYYCESGSPYPTPCQPGTYSPSEGNTAVSDCLPCSFGEYCGSYNLTQSTGKLNSNVKSYQHIYSCNFLSCHHAE